MLQTIKKNFYLAALMVACMLVLAGTASAAAQSSSSDKQTVAAPGTAPISAEDKAALTAPYTGPSYKNRWEIYGGLSYMNGQAGQNLPDRYNMGGVEVMGTYWLGPDLLGGHVSRLGVIGDYRFEAGTTPLYRNPYYNRVVVMQSIPSGGIALRGPKNRYAAIDLHGLVGGSSGHFDYAINHYPGGSPVAACPANQGQGTQIKGNLGLYCDHTAAWGAAGGSIDFNESQKLAIRLSPEIIFEHFGTETREFFSISAGALYRFGKK
jgi:hypothetical protein